MNKRLWDIEIGLETSDRIVAKTEEEAKAIMINRLARRIETEGFYNVFWDRTYEIGESEEQEE